MQFPWLVRIIIKAIKVFIYNMPRAKKIDILYRNFNRITVELISTNINLIAVPINKYHSVNIFIIFLLFIIYSQTIAIYYIK